MINWLNSTAWPMVKWQAYGFEHLTFTIIGLLISILVAWLLRRKSIKQLDRIIFIIGVLLLLSEIYKQLFYTFVIGKGEYQWWIFPFQLCSVPIYLCLIIPFIKNKRIKMGMEAFLVSYNLMGGFVAFIEPSGLVHEYVTLTYHAFCWHMSLIFLGLLISFNKNTSLKEVPFKWCLMTFVSLCVIAFIINLALWKVSEGSVNMFYVGPANSPIIVFKDISARLGWYINTPIYMAALTGGGYLFYRIARLINRWSINH